jgi:cytochrome c-type biogenesis protein CcmE
MKRRLIVVTGIIIVVLVIILAVVGGGNAAKSVTVADLDQGNYVNQRVQVSGNVVNDSYHIDGNVLTFDIQDPDDIAATPITVSYDSGVSATFGNGVTAICTGKIDGSGVLQCSELVTKCPSKYESSTDALTVSKLLDYGDSVVGKTVKVTGTISGTIQNGTVSGARFTLVDGDDASKHVEVYYDGAMPDGATQEGASVVLTGDLGENESFNATDVALKG